MHTTKRTKEPLLATNKVVASGDYLIFKDLFPRNFTGLKIIATTGTEIKIYIKKTRH
jgi:hypothetical protein